MKEKIAALLDELLDGPRRFPVEAALGITFFIISVIGIALGETRYVYPILSFFIPLVCLTFWLQPINRIAYWASYFLFIPLFRIPDLRDFQYTSPFYFTYLIAVLLLVMGSKRLDNYSFAAHALHVFTKLLAGLLIVGLFHLLVAAIMESFFYIFNINAPHSIDVATFFFVWFILGPQVCGTLIRQDEYEASEPGKTMRKVLSLILTPAVIIYTVILYFYFFKILLFWELPRGGVASMVMGFIAVAFIGKITQTTIKERHRHYDWFYNRLTFIAIPPLILYWVGSIHRISLYSFTEGRFYLILAGLLMTLFVLMLYHERTRRYQLMAVIFSVSIALFTYIPGISAQSIGLRCQEHRLEALISELNLKDNKTGKLTEDLNLNAIIKDDVACKKYQDFCGIVEYVRDIIGSERFSEKYGSWSYSKYNFTADSPRYDSVTTTQPFSVAPYTTLLPAGYEKFYTDGTIQIKDEDGEVVVNYPIRQLLESDSTYTDNRQQLLTYRNDSLLLVLEEIEFTSDTISYVAPKFWLFRKDSESREKK